MKGKLICLSKVTQEDPIHNTQQKYWPENDTFYISEYSYQSHWRRPLGKHACISKWVAAAFRGAATSLSLLWLHKLQKWNNFIVCLWAAASQKCWIASSLRCLGCSASSSSTFCTVIAGTQRCQARWEQEPETPSRCRWGVPRRAGSSSSGEAAPWHRLGRLCVCVCERRKTRSWQLCVSSVLQLKRTLAESMEVPVQQLVLVQSGRVLSESAALSQLRGSVNICLSQMCSARYCRPGCPQLEANLGQTFLSGFWFKSIHSCYS